ncbi:galactose-specific lectin nattectin-like [Latimeria chalumnae]|uniref:galactose-specific lectin nattectin-like n=1 Tax=Latimeria chalumnae TaxID=7897 RepID=UPI00313DF2AB
MVASMVKLALALLVCVSIVHCHPQVEYEKESFNSTWYRCPIHGIHKWKRYGNLCLKFFKVPLNFHRAKKHCENIVQGGRLVSIHSAFQNRKIIQLIQNEAGSCPRTWIGGYRQLFKKSFYWLDGSRWNYSNWAPGEPNNFFFFENCLEMNYPHTGAWNDIRCWYRKPFVCEKVLK